MSTMGSFATAISGLEANSQALSVISDNIVNANTTGFKSARSEFQNFLAEGMDLSNSGQEIGRGTSIAGITALYSQGTLNRTGRGTDIAINGNGFFVMNDPTRGKTFTRDGAFRFDKDGWLTNINGNRVQAFAAGPQGKISGVLGDIRLPFDTIPARATEKIQLHVNLDARLAPGEAIDLKKPDESAHFSTALQLFDSIGNGHAVSVYFNKTGERSWEWYAMTDGASIEGGEAGVKSAIAKGELEFNQMGALESSSQEMLGANFAGGAVSDQQLQFDFGDAIKDDGTGKKGTTQFGSKSAIFRNSQDGFSAGTLLDSMIDNEGVIKGIYSNGTDQVLGQLAMARFEATERLSRVGENQFKETLGSGQAIIGKATDNGLGSVVNNSLEASNVDLAKEFVDMIRVQRGFQASAKSINTANEMLDELLAIVARAQA